jgi:hypothetical protein
MERIKRSSDHGVGLQTEVAQLQAEMEAMGQKYMEEIEAMKVKHAEELDQLKKVSEMVCRLGKTQSTPRPPDQHSL